ncbi:MAG: nickel pincer cofactor biosynthesis protein LarB [Planctomycetes bacterium]|nr:nickel pincer cofactor biosynthesis protein LarB [Planctomycetota bacterium]
MTPEDVEQLARQLITGQITPGELVRRLSGGPTLDLGEVQLDVDRHRRCGFAEVIYGEGKSTTVLKRAIAALNAQGFEALVTRVTAEQAAGVLEEFPGARHNTHARTLRVKLAESSLESRHQPASADKQPEGCTPTEQRRTGKVAILSAGTSDLPVAEEARETADWTGANVTLIADVGVAGPHRLRERLTEFETADAIVVVAGMEGALPSVVAGYVAVPVIAVPTSVGYGANFGGLAALLAMLNSCAAHVCVVNIDAGFKAGYLAGMIAARTASARQTDLQARS